MRTLLVALVLGAVAPVLHAQDALPLGEVKASSYMQTRTQSYRPENAIDRDLKKWWTPAPPASNGSNSYLWVGLEASEGQAYVVTHVDIHPGSHYPDYPGYGDIFRKNLRLRQAKLEFSDGTSEDIFIKDLDQVQRIQLKATHRTTYVKLIPKAVFKSDKWQDLCISYFRPLGYRYGAEESNSFEPINRDAVLGAWLNPNDPCQEAYRIVWKDNAGLYFYVEAYLMDAIAGEVHSARADFNQNPPRIELQVTYGGSEELHVVSLAEYPHNALNATLAQQATKGTLSLETYMAAHSHYAFETWVVGDYTDSTAEAWRIAADRSIYSELGSGTLTYEMMGLYGNCGELKVTWDDGSTGYYGVSFDGGTTRIVPILCPKEEEGEMPDCNLAATPWLTKTN